MSVRSVIEALKEEVHKASSVPCEFNDVDEGLASMMLTISLASTINREIDTIVKELVEMSKPAGATDVFLETALGLVLTIIRKMFALALAESRLGENDAKKIYRTFARALYLALLAIEDDLVSKRGVLVSSPPGYVR